jgi:hypothetical protein
MSAGFQIGTELLKIVDFSVEDRHDGTVPAEKGLNAVFRIKDRQTAVCKRTMVVNIFSVSIRSPVEHRAAHGMKNVFDISSIAVDDSCDSAHIVPLLFVSITI